MDLYEMYTKAASKFLSEAFDDEDLEVGGFEEDPEEGSEGTEISLDDDDELDLGDEEETEEMMTCPDCNGEGVIVGEDGEETECETCGGEGEVKPEDTTFDFNPDEGVCPCCGCKLNVVDSEGEDELDLDDEESEDGEGLELDDEDEDGIELDDDEDEDLH